MKTKDLLKYAVPALLAGMLLAACAGQVRTYTVEGEWKGGDGERIYLKKDLGNRRYEIQDSAVVQDGRFLMSGPLREVDERILQVGREKHVIVLDSVPIRVVCRTEKVRSGEREVNRLKTTVTGSVEQEIFRTMLSVQYNETLIMLGLSLLSDEDRAVPGRQDSLVAAYMECRQNTRRVLDSLVENYRDSYAVALIINNVLARQRETAEVEEMYEGLTPRIKASCPGRRLKATLDRMKTAQPGNMAPDFTLADTAGREVSLSAFRGKYLLLDFWASWCGPCLEEVPNLKGLYAEYHGKGLEILSISLDDKREKWTEAIDRLGLEWRHASSLKGWKCPVAVKYSVTGIPAIFLLDTDGKILAAGLRGEGLRAALDSLMHE